MNWNLRTAVVIFHSSDFYSTAVDFPSITLYVLTHNWDLLASFYCLIWGRVVLTLATFSCAQQSVESVADEMFPCLLGAACVGLV